MKTNAYCIAHEAENVHSNHMQFGSGDLGCFVTKQKASYAVANKYGSTWVMMWHVFYAMLGDEGTD